MIIVNGNFDFSFVKNIKGVPRQISNLHTAVIIV